MLRGKCLVAGSAILGVIAIILSGGSGTWGAAGDREISAGSCIGDGSDTASVVFGGYTEGELFTAAAISTELAGTQDGWFAVISDYVPGDINLDGSVSAVDLEVLCEQWLGEPGVPTADIAPTSGDGLVDMADSTVLAGNWHFAAVAAAGEPEPDAQPGR